MRYDTDFSIYRRFTLSDLELIGWLLFCGCLIATGLGFFDLSISKITHKPVFSSIPILEMVIPQSWVGFFFSILLTIVGFSILLYVKQIKNILRRLH